MGKRIILHDWNGCLLDDAQHRFANGVVPIFKHFGLQVPTFADYSHNITSDFMKFYYDRGIPDSGNRKADGDMLNEIMIAGLVKAEVPPLFPEAREFLEELRSLGARQMLVSTLPTAEFDRQVDHHGVRAYFDELHSDIRKKHDVYADLLRRYGIAPEEAVGFTDMMSDVRELNLAGVAAIIIPRGHITPDFTQYEGADLQMYVADDLKQALALSMLIDA